MHLRCPSLLVAFEKRIENCAADAGYATRRGGSGGSPLEQLFERFHNCMTEIFCPGEMAHSSSERCLDRPTA